MVVVLVVAVAGVFLAPQQECLGIELMCPFICAQCRCYLACFLV
jgi:hypothetical protein